MMLKGLVMTIQRQGWLAGVRLVAVILLPLLGVSCVASEPLVRIKDITQLAGEHPNRISGLGLVTGLAGTGGSSPTTRMLALQVLQKMGNRADPSLRENIQRSQEKTDNISVVSVNAILPPHAKPGQRIDATVSAFDNAKSLNGGVLEFAELLGVDGQVYAIAGGAISTNGGNFGGNASSVVKNHPTTGRIPFGAVVEVAVPCTLIEHDVFRLLLMYPEYTTAQNISKALNQYSPECSAVVDAATVAVRLPADALSDPFRFIAECQDLTVMPGSVARVVINERTGTVVIGSNVKLSQVAITHGNLIVSTAETPEVSQPNPFAEGDTTVVPRTQIDVTEQGAAISVMEQTVTVGDLAASLNALGVSPRDLSSIFQMLKECGALHAELELK
jgi:flagellar P-ring protein precursor FlgI